MTQAKQTYTTPRRAVLRGLLAAPLAAAPLSAALADDGLSPRLAALKAEFEAAHTVERALSTLPAEEAEERWEAALGDVNEITFRIMQEPVHSFADFGFKLHAWHYAIRDPNQDSGDIAEVGYWMERAPCRLLDDARKLMGEA